MSLSVYRITKCYIQKFYYLISNEYRAPALPILSSAAGNNPHFVTAALGGWCEGRRVCKTHGHTNLCPCKVFEDLRKILNLERKTGKRGNYILCTIWQIFFKYGWQVFFKVLQVGPQMHRSTSQTPSKCRPSTGAIWNNSSCLRLYKLVNECTSPLVEHLPRMDNPCMQSRTTLSF